MRHVFILITAIILLGCSDNCINRYDFSNSTEDIPIIPIDFGDSEKAIRLKIESQFEEDLCDKCDWVEFKLPMQFGDRDGHLKVKTDYGYPICENCGVPIELNYNFRISINRFDMVFAKSRITSVDSLSFEIVGYFQNVGNSVGHYPKRFDQVIFTVDWDEGTNDLTITNVLREISEGHLEFVESMFIRNGNDFCSMSSSELSSLKNEYPLNIELDLGKQDKINAPLREKYERMKEVENKE
jgi:hypothetical protein